MYSLPGSIIAAISVFAFITLSSPGYTQAPALVHVDKVKKQPLTQTVPVIGKLVALRAGNVAARIAGSVDDMRVKVGDRVKSGQVLALLSAEALKAQVNLAQSSLLDAEAELKTEQAQADLSRKELKRQEGLKKSVAFSQARYEDAKQKLVVSLAKVERAKAKIAIKKSSLDIAKLNLAYATVKAPYDGVVVQSFTENGAYLRNGDPIIRLIDDRSLEAEAEVPFNRIAGLTIGRAVTLQFDNSKKYDAKVRAVLPSENPLTRTRLVRFTPDFKKRPQLLAEGQSLTLSIPAGEQREVVSVHKDAILKRGGADIVYLVVKGKAVPKRITLGEGINGRVEVLGGLKTGDEVVVRGNERLRPGSAVTVVKGAS